jgi:hypothetical protein
MRFPDEDGTRSRLSMHIARVHARSSLKRSHSAAFCDLEGDGAPALLGEPVEPEMVYAAHGFEDLNDDHG